MSSKTNSFIIPFLSRTLDFILLFELIDLFVAGRDHSAADQPNLVEASPPIATIVSYHFAHCELATPAPLPAGPGRCYVTRFETALCLFSLFIDCCAET
jgi:hypothetical protein